MSHEFTITGPGLQVDKVMILPGSTLVLSAAPPAHWSRFGEAVSKTLNVATPEASVTADKPLRARRPKAAE